MLDGAGATEQLGPVGLDELARLDRAGEVLIVDVREREERDEGYIAGSRHIPFRLARDFAGDLRGGKPVVTICESGARAAIAASVLAHEGVDARAGARRRRGRLVHASATAPCRSAAAARPEPRARRLTTATRGTRAHGCPPPRPPTRYCRKCAVSVPELRRKL